VGGGKRNYCSGDTDDYSRLHSLNRLGNGLRLCPYNAEKVVRQQQNLWECGKRSDSLHTMCLNLNQRKLGVDTSEPSVFHPKIKPVPD